MKIVRWLQELLRGAYKTPQQIVKAAKADAWAFHDDSLVQRVLGEGPPLADAKGWRALKRLTVPQHFFTEDIYLRQSERADWQTVNPQIKYFAAKLVEVLRKQGIPFFVHSAFRTKDEQDRLVLHGRSKAAWPRAPHAQGEAVDLVHSRYAWELTRDEWAMIGKIGKELAHRLGLEVVWGGDWSFYDPAHWEIRDWRQRIKDEIVHGEPIRKSPRKILREMAGGLPAPITKEQQARNKAAIEAYMGSNSS